MQVELVAHTPITSVSSMGRYPRELYNHLSKLVSVRLTHGIDPPLANNLTVLRHFPLGVEGHQSGSVTHFMQIMGCSQMLWNPVHPAVATVHDLGVLICEEDKALFSPLERMILDIQLAGLRRMDKLIADSEFTRQGLIEVFGFSPQNVHVAHLGISSQFRPMADARERLAERYSLQMNDDSYYLLYVGSELPRKNLAVLLITLAQLKRHGYRMKLLKVGNSGGERWRKQFLAEIERQDLISDVIILGVVPEKDLPLFYSAVDLYVTSSLLEGFGWPVLEAMACGTPVVCSNAGSLPEIVEDAAITVDPRDATAMTAAIEVILGNEQLRHNLSDLGRKQAAKFTWDKTIESVLAVYRALV